MQELFKTLNDSYRKGVFSKRTVYYFSVDDEKKTVILDPERCTIEDGKTVDNPDCSCKTSMEMFKKIWFDGYRPGIMDFLNGSIKADNPLLLKQFIEAFGK